MEGVGNLCWWLITHREEEPELSDDLLSDAACASKIMTIGLTRNLGDRLSDLRHSNPKAALRWLIRVSCWGICWGAPRPPDSITCKINDLPLAQSGFLVRPTLWNICWSGLRWGIYRQGPDVLVLLSEVVFGRSADTQSVANPAFLRVSGCEA